MLPLLLLSFLPALVAAVPSLNLSSPSSLTAASGALTNLLTYYVPNARGIFDEAQTPWHESAMIWGAFGDYLKWSGDGQFANTVSEALANMSFNAEQSVALECWDTLWEADYPGRDFLNGAQASLQGAAELRTGFFRSCFINASHSRRCRDDRRALG